MSQPYIIFECGPTHRGCESAIDLVYHSFLAGADAVKFQMIDADRLCSDPFQAVAYTDCNGEQTEGLRDVLRRRMMTMPEWVRVANTAAVHGLDFILTCGFDDEVDLAVQLGCSAIKIASGDIDHTPLIRYVATKPVDIHLDTGNATMAEVLDAYNVIIAAGHDREIWVHHCPTGYPAKPESINLHMMGAIAGRGIRTAYSCHTLGTHMCAAAIAMGADMIEKTLTMSRQTPGPEHIMSLEPHEAGPFVQTMREVYTALGASDRTFTPEQDRARRMVRRKLRNGVWSRPGV